MKQKLTARGCAALQQQLSSSNHYIAPDGQIVEQLARAQAAYFWEGTAMELAYAPRLLKSGLETLRPEPGWEIQTAVMMLIADQRAGSALSLQMVDELTSYAEERLKKATFTCGTAFADLGVGALRLVLAEGEAPVRAPERLTRLTLRTLSLLVGGTRLDREELLGDCMTGTEFAEALTTAILDDRLEEFRRHWREVPSLAITELQTIDGKSAAAEELSDLLLDRYHNDLPSDLGMRYIPQFLGRWFPLDRMQKETL